MKPNRKFLYALDVGSRKITLAAQPFAMDRRTDSLIVETQPSRGVFKGVVNDLASLSDSVHKVFQKMEARLRARATETALAVNGNYVYVRRSAAAVALSEHGTRSINRRDMERLNKQARHLGLELTEHLLHEYPQGYIVDRHSATVNPLGLHGRRFEVDLLLISAENSYLENIIKAVTQTGVDVVQLAFSGIAAGEAVLGEDDKERGAVLIDIGDTLTTLLIFKDGIPRYVSVFSFGGRNLTEVIANYFKISPALADELKETALELEGVQAGEVMVKTEDAYRAIPKSELAALIRPEIEKFSGTLKGLIAESGVPGLSAAPVVVTGGLSLLGGLLEKMEDSLQAAVRIGLIKGHTDIPASKAPAYASAIGLLALQQNLLRQGSLAFHARGKNKIAGLVDYLVSLYRDYF